MSPSTTTPRHSTNTRNGTSAASAMPPMDVSRRASARTPSTTAPASAAHAGENPSTEVTAKPINVSASTTSTNTGTLVVSRDRLGVGCHCEVAREKPTQ